VPTFAELLHRDRPDEEVIEAALASQSGVLRFFEVSETGLSTADPQIAQHHREQGRSVHEITVATLTLDDVFARVKGGIIHWLKIDVEGFEREVLLGWRTSVRPWVVVIESAFPNSQVETHEQWEDLLLQKGYVLVYRDGVNRYYLSPEHIELTPAFQFGPNVFDGFQIAESHWAVAEVRRRYESAMQKLTASAEAQFWERQMHFNQNFAARLEKLANLLKGVLDRKNEKISAQEKAIAFQEAQQQQLHELLVRAEAQLALLKEIALAKLDPPL
jgi:FkbM family methyltransferase